MVAGDGARRTYLSFVAALRPLAFYTCLLTTKHRGTMCMDALMNFAEHHPFISLMMLSCVLTTVGKIVPWARRSRSDEE